MSWYLKKKCNKRYFCCAGVKGDRGFKGGKGEPGIDGDRGYDGTPGLKVGNLVNIQKHPV